MATQNSLQDCYFYFYSSCTKGDECPFRHCQLALGTETVCSLWKEGRCFRNNCKFRHMESRINRSMIPCYWENQPGGCRKPHCVFLHRKLKNGVQVINDTPGLILPTSDGKISPKLPDLYETSNVPNNISLVEKMAENDVAPDSALIPVPPLVLSFDEGEESDAESVTGTPMKQGDKKATLTRNQSVKVSGAAEEKDFGIKTLEQIRMEKIHKESDSYYGAAYTSTPLDTPRLMDQHYPPKAEYLVISKDSLLDKSLPASILEPKLSGPDEETDLRGRLSNRRNVASNKVNQVKQFINFKKQNANQVEVNSIELDFKIKTLEEIRRERENKQNKPDVDFSNSLGDFPSSENKKPLNITREKISKKLKINRKPKELCFVPAVCKQNISLNPSETAATHLISNGIQKISVNSSKQSNEIPFLNKASLDSPGKRKSGDDLYSTASKIVKLVATSNDNCEQVNQVNACSDRISENCLQSFPQQSEIHSSPVPNEATDKSSQIHDSPSSINQIFVTETEMNALLTSTPTTLSSSTLLPSHSSEEKSWHTSDEIHDKTPNFSTLPISNKSDVNSNNNAKKDKDNLIDRSMSVDDDLDEFLGGDDMNIDEMDATPNDDILLQIEEFLES